MVGMLEKLSKPSKHFRKPIIIALPTITMPYASKSQQAGWYKEQGESSRSSYSEAKDSEERIISSPRSMGRTLARTQATKICTGDDFLRLDNTEGDDKGPQAGKCPRKDEERVWHFRTIPWNILIEIENSPILRRPRPIKTPTKFKTRKISILNRFLRGGGGGNHNHRGPEGRKDNTVDCKTEIIATIIRGINGKEILKSSYLEAQPGHATKELKPLVELILTFGPEDMRLLQTPYNDALMIQRKIATAMVYRILMNTGTSADIITPECLKKLQYNKKD
ncbi:LOW QUALITY PROTEIN: hypothetical protein Cgig2_015887 [Carnegiea gigantea]|uniref:Uncharacterized protein n=1 Tax=Carnegiea gigantea TaxID=171969 RepID=A0A9Q1GTS0_9CARY|nr:LOW QUALITY PROTEIN: hypothetical protein Cgig2_015887 [Carnegiea gigantea]